MSRSSIRVARSAVQLRRPIGLALLSGTGVVCGLALTVLAMALIAYKASLGIPLAVQIVEITLAILVPFTIVWFYWGLWDVMQSAWWSHVIGGPLAVVGLGGHSCGAMVSLACWCAVFLSLCIRWWQPVLPGVRWGFCSSRLLPWRTSSLRGKRSVSAHRSRCGNVADSPVLP
jgi:hypothetical protein